MAEFMADLSIGALLMLPLEIALSELLGLG
jgi:hypothetical protein